MFVLLCLSAPSLLHPVLGVGGGPAVAVFQVGILLRSRPLQKRLRWHYNIGVFIETLQNFNSQKTSSLLWKEDVLFISHSLSAY